MEEEKEGRLHPLQQKKKEKKSHQRPQLQLQRLARSQQLPQLAMFLRRLASLPVQQMVSHGWLPQRLLRLLLLPSLWLR